MSATPTSPRLYYWSETADAFVPVPPAADTPALRELLGVDALREGDGGEVIMRFCCVEALP